MYSGYPDGFAFRAVTYGMSGDDNERDERVWEDGPWAPEWCYVDRRDFLLTLGVAGAGAAAGCTGTDNEQNGDEESDDEELIEELRRLFDEIEVLVEASGDVVLVDYRSEALRTLYGEIDASDSNSRVKQQLLDALGSSIQQNQQAGEAILDTDLKTVVENHDTVDATLEAVVDVVEQNGNIPKEVADKWIAKVSEIHDARDNPVAVHAEVEAGPTSDAVFDRFEQLHERIRFS